MHRGIVALTVLILSSLACGVVGTATPNPNHATTFPVKWFPHRSPQILDLQSLRLPKHRSWRHISTHSGRADEDSLPHLGTG